MSGSIVIAGAIARRWTVGGHVWALLQWVLGFRRMGFEVLFLDRLDPAPDVRDSAHVRGFVELMRSFGLDEAYSLDLGPDEDPVGVSRADVRARLRDADLLLNIMGYLEDADLLALARRRVFLDIDPGFGQMWRTLEWCDLFEGHDAFLTVGANLGHPDCRVPDCGLPWIGTLPPVVLDLWPTSGEAGRHFTSVGSWRGPYDPIEFEGTTYGLRAHEFRRYASLPHSLGLPFEAVLAIDEADASDAECLRRGGWGLIAPDAVARTPADYQRYVRGSRAEFMVAKGMYVHTRSGWFSDRTACYLATGRPAIVQDTGLESVLETGMGLLVFRDPDEAKQAVLAVHGDWARHARAAGELARAHLDSEVVLARALDRVAA